MTRCYDNDAETIPLRKKRFLHNSYCYLNDSTLQKVNFKVHAVATTILSARGLKKHKFPSTP